MRTLLAAAGLALLAVTSPSDAQESPSLSPTAAASLDAAKAAFKASNWTEALAQSLQVLAERAEDHDALYIAGASERQLDKLDDAERHLTTLTTVAPDYPFAHHRLGNVRFLQGEALAREGNVDGAREKYSASADEFAKEIARDPTQLISVSSRAIALARAGRFQESIAAHQAWIDLAPGANEPVVSLASTCALAGQPDQAMAALDRLPQGDPAARTEALSAVAKAFVARSQWAEAVPFLERAASVDPESAQARLELTEAYARASRFDDAANSLATLLTLSPTPEQAAAAGNAITTVLGGPRPPGVEPPELIRLPEPRYPEEERGSVQTTVLVLACVAPPHDVAEAVVVPNRIWKDLRASGFEREAIDAVRRAKFKAGTKDGEPVALWTVVPVEFQPG